MHDNSNRFAAPGSHASQSAQQRRAFLSAPLILLCLAAAFYFFFAAGTTCAQSQRSRGAAQASPSPTPTPAPQLTRSSTRHEKRRLGYGGTLTVYGAPEGSITVEAWPRNEVDVTAEIELKGATEEELALIASVNNFVLDEDGSHLTLFTTGTHDRKFMQRAARDFPKRLLTLPWKIDYRIRVPAQVDLEIFAGRGALDIRHTDGALSLNAGESTVALALDGGDIVSTVAGGAITLRVRANSWRGRGASIRLGRGELNVELPPAFNADLDATVLRSGRVENSHPALTSRERTASPERQLRARAGAGGASFVFEVGDGVIRIKQATNEK